YASVVPPASAVVWRTTAPTAVTDTPVPVDSAVFVEVEVKVAAPVRLAEPPFARYADVVWLVVAVRTAPPPPIAPTPTRTTFVFASALIVVAVTARVVAVRSACGPRYALVVPPAFAVGRSTWIE